MSDRLKIAMAQVDCVVGDVDGNAARLGRALQQAEAEGADLVVTPELGVSGYPPEDLVLKVAFQDRCAGAVHDLAKMTRPGGPALLVGSPWRKDGALHNAALLLEDGEIRHVRLKHELPNYGVFDEKRVFTPGPLPGPVPFRGARLGIMVCEDMWYPDVAEALAEMGAEILIVPNGSPFEADKADARLNLAVERVSENKLPLVYVNLVGGQDELVFDGGSFVLGADYALRARAPFFTESLTMTEWTRDGDGWTCAETAIVPTLERSDNIYSALVLGLRDYVAKNRFNGIVLGLSGGVDSALSAAVAVDALGPENVHALMMPSPYTSRDSLEDAAAVAAFLGIGLDEINIGPAMEAFAGMLKPLFGDRDPDVTEENIQARSRGILLMAVSNKFGHMLLTTGNKSEMSVGYATLYGDMAGGYSVLKDVYKTTAFELCHWRNAHRADWFLGPDGRVMPERVITKPPTAELRADQKDEDTLPPYPVLDGILHCLVEREMSLDDTVAEGYEREVVRAIWKMLDRAEYKRRQAPPGVKISSRAFGRDRRYPITNGFTNLV
jgi:NAD+ synthase